jgi:hypothetical protein
MVVLVVFYFGWLVNFVGSKQVLVLVCRHKVQRSLDLMVLSGLVRLRPRQARTDKTVFGFLFQFTRFHVIRFPFELVQKQFHENAFNYDLL